MRAGPSTLEDAAPLRRDLRPHPSAEIEWWYLFGFLDLRYTILACFWRYRGRGWWKDGLVAAYALTEINGPRRWQATLVDHPMFALTREKLKELLRQHYDPFFEAVLEITEGGQIIAPYRLVDTAHCRSTDRRPIDIVVGPCQLHHDARTRTLHLAIEDNDLQVRLRFDLSASPFPMGGTGSFDIDGKTMWGYTYPQAPTAGTITIAGLTEHVSGASWHDHQWGDWAFENPTGTYYHPEWQYFAVLLDDGRSVNLYRCHRPGLTGREDVHVPGLNPVLYQPDGTLRILERATVTCREHIESLRTHNLYEYGWSIELPEVDGLLELVPFHPDHEIFVFTQKRGLMEIGCQVTGRLYGQPCHGVGFVEAFGATVDINSFFWGQRKTNLAQQLERFMPRRFEPAWLRRICGVQEPLAVDADAIEHAIIGPIWSMMDRGGKGWRSTWLTICCHALGQDNFDPRVREFLPVIELLHTGSLIIDDIQDGSPLRRGQAALHTQVGTDLAINAGNFLYFLPLIIIREARWLTDTQRAEIYDTVTNGLRQGHLGQALDLMWSKGRYDMEAKIEAFERTREQLLEQYRLKSGCQLEAIARIAGIITRAPESLVAPLADYSRTFGIVFQIVDDLIDLQEGREKLGKTEGEDLRNGKLNMALLYALSAATPSRRAAVIRAILGGNGDDPLPLIRDIVLETAAADRCMDDAEAMIDGAWRGLAALPATDAKVIIRSVPKWLLQQRRIKQRELG